MSKLTPKQEAQLMSDIFSFQSDMLGFVLYTFPWGEAGTPLADEEGPDVWQVERMEEIRSHVEANLVRQRNREHLVPFQKSISSGHGIGKSTFFAWFDLWLMSCWPGSSTVVTANKESQLKGKTWPELGKWHTMAINSHWFERGALSLRPKPWLAQRVAEQMKVDSGKWSVNAETWSEENPAAFQGLHNDVATGIIYDEASGIPQPIWEASLGALTDAKSMIFWLVFGNPNENSGPFFETHNRFRHRWNPVRIDSRSVKRTNKEFLQQIVDDYGEDDDVTRVRVKGEFPRQGENQFLSSEAIDIAAEREVYDDPGAPLVMGVDVARFGSGKSIIRFRRGRDARSIKPVRLTHKTATHVAAEVAWQIDEWRPDAVFIDGGGLGAGPIDILRDRGYRVQEVNFGSVAEEKDRFPDRRTEMWWRLGEAMEDGLAIDDNRDLLTDLKAPFREYDGRGRVKLESKEKMARRGIDSPDDGDALALTFASRVARRDTRTSRAGSRLRVAQGVDYDVLG